jgi:hypothetical protein
METVAQDDDKTKYVWWHCKELCDVALEAEIGNNGRREVTKGVQAVDHQEVADSINPEQRIQQCLLRDLGVESFVLFVGCEGTHASNGEDTLFLGEELGVLRVIGHVEPDHDPPKDSGDTGKDEEPLPAGQIGLAIKKRNSCREETTKSAGDGDGTCKNGKSCCSLRGFVPVAQVHDNTGEEASFCDTEEESNSK